MNKKAAEKSQGYKEEIIIDSVIMGQAKRYQRNLLVCYFHYKKKP